MTLDSSAVIAILFSEPGCLNLVDLILEAPHARIGAPTLVESGLVFIGRTRAQSQAPVDDLMEELGVTVAPFGEREWRMAVDAFQRYGRGRHRASLNFGDCLAYASAASASDSLLFTGNDFRLTDLRAAL